MMMDLYHGRKERMEKLDQIIFQKYRLIQLLGTGVSSQVYLAEHVNLKSYRAIKVISKNNPFYEIQRKEAFILKNLKHSCIPIVYDIEEDEESSYIIEQYFEGPTLKEYIKEYGPLSEQVIQSFGIQLCHLICYLHSEQSPILYLDLKPENIIIEGNRLKLIDFGSAKYRNELTARDHYCGTKGYAAPELYGHTVIDERCDVYSIGKLLKEMVSQGQFIQENKVTNYSRKLSKIIQRCIRYNPSGRYSSVKQLEKALYGFKKHSMKSVHSSMENQFKVMIAGTQKRMGTTHVSFRLCNFYISSGMKCLYVEKNSRESIGRIIQCYHGVYGEDGLYHLGPLKVLSNYSRCNVMERPEEVLVYDMGVLSEDNLEEFLSGDVCYVVAGGKDWEMEETERVIRIIPEYKEVKYLFNLLGGKQFKTVVKQMGKVPCYRIPYQPDPFTMHIHHQEKLFFKQLGSY